ncbi:MAG: hypothetical protein EBU90_01315 [Proteobacteria bacterium]|nr:hypothetical protein [Pseudomonadota bacterium]
MDDSGMLPVEGGEKAIKDTEDCDKDGDVDDCVGVCFHRRNNLIEITDKAKNKIEIPFDSEARAVP